VPAALLDLLTLLFLVVNSAGANTFSQTINSTPDPSVSIDAGGAAGSVVKVQINGQGALSLTRVFEN